jgi:hypothetical protein
MYPKSVIDSLSSIAKTQLTQAFSEALARGIDVSVRTVSGNITEYDTENYIWIRDSTKNWTPGSLKGFYVLIGDNILRRIVDNDTNTITLSEPLPAGNYTNVLYEVITSISKEDFVQLRTELYGIRVQTEKFTFDTYNNLKVVSISTRTTPVQELNNASIAANSYTEIVKSDLSIYSAIALTVKATYASTATSGVRVRWLYSPDGTNYDSIEDAEAQGNYEDLSFAAGATRQRTIVIPILQPYVKIQIINLDTSAAVTVSAWITLLG